MIAGRYPVRTFCLVLALGWSVAVPAWSQTPAGPGTSEAMDQHPPVTAETATAGTAAAAAGEPGQVPSELGPTTGAGPAARRMSRQTLIASLTIFMLAVFVGFEVIAKVPPTLHTPLMSGSNAISGITLVGAVIVAGAGYHFSSFLGFLAVMLATINVVGGFVVTHRMLAMFKRKQGS